MEKKYGKELMREVPGDVCGAVIYGIGIYCFAGNADFATGGVSGLALILRYLFGLPMGWMSMLLNIPMILISMRILGRYFMVSSVKTMVIYSLILDYVIPFLPVYSGDATLAAVCTGVFMGLGLTPVYYHGGSTGGTDFLVMSMKHIWPHISVGQLTWLVDGCVILIGGAVFRNADSLILGMVTVYLCGVCMDKVLYGLGAGKVVMAITEKKPQAAERIAEICDRGCTFISAVGSYTGEQKDVLMCACSSRQVVEIKKIIHGLDPGAFVIILNSNEVLGEGFKRLDS